MDRRMDSVAVRGDSGQLVSCVTGNDGGCSLAADAAAFHSAKNSDPTAVDRSDSLV